MRLTSSLLLLAACNTSDTNVTKYTEAPVVSITTPAEGAELAENEELTFVAQVTDDADGLEDLIYAWTRQDGAELMGTLELLDGEVRFTVPEGLPDGDYEIELKVTDTSYQDGRDSVAISIVDNAAPTIEFLSPLDGAILGDLDLITVDVLVADTDEDDLNNISLAWGGDLVDGAPANPTSDGHARYTVDPQEPGTYAISLVATDSIGSTASAEVIFEVVPSDADGDGYAGVESGGDDCDDDDTSIHPGAEETCDDVDQDCDGNTDENAVDAPVRYADADGDGYGDASSSIQLCEDPGGYVANADDCDDGDPAENPDADEVCDGDDDDCDGDVDEADAVDAPTWYADVDGDTFGDPANTSTACTVPAGYTDDTRDCDDLDPEVNPEAAEVCNLLDDDCDGAVDEGAVDASSWYADTDSDSYGDPIVITTSCEQPADFVADDQDCDDTDPLSHPGAGELCDGRDNDCDGSVDEDADATDARTWYLDADGDDHGVSGTTIDSCVEPDGFSAVPDDCDDTNVEIFPGAAEVCNGIDDDCDGGVDLDATDAPEWYADVDLDTYGDPGSTVASCSLPSGFVADNNDCDDSSVDIHPAADELCNGVDDDCDGDVDEADALDAGTWYADTDADTYGDIGLFKQSCAQPIGFSANADDCDDGNAAIYPGATEVCDGLDDNCDGNVDEDTAVDAPEWYADADDDSYGTSVSTTRACEVPPGYVDNLDDCNDFESSVHPGADETCNGEDDDCDGVEDESAIDAPTWYADADGDRFGTTSTTTVGCSAPSGYVGNSDDCDDTDAEISPAEAELCDTFDNNCDGTVDEATAVDAPTWYADADADTYGNPVVSARACSAPPSYVANGDDCDDTLAAVNPAATETCITEGDDDCDGLTNEVGAASCSSFYPDSDADGYGGDTPSCQCAASDSYPVTTAGDCDDSDADEYPGAPEVCENGVDEDCDGDDVYCPLEGTIGAAAYDVKYLGPSASASLGYDLAFVPDVDGDGADEVLLGAPAMSSSTGAAFLMYGGETGSISVSTSAAWITGGASSDYLGVGLAGGDFDADGVGDLLIGAYGADEGGTNSGGAWVAHGPAHAGVWAVNSYDDYGWYGSTTADYLGYDVAALPDVDGDGSDEVALGAYLQDSGASNAGAVYIQFGPIEASSTHQSAATVPIKIVGEASSDFLGASVAAAGDFDGDGAGDLAMSAHGDDTVDSSAGAFYVATSLDGLSGTVDASVLDYKFVGDSASDTWGYSSNVHPLSTAGDTNDDGYSDVVIGCYGDDDSASNAGAAYVVLGGGATGTYAMSAMAIKLYGDGASDAFGYSVTGGADVDGDGFDDFAVGGPYDDDSASNAGAVYLYYGNAAADWTDVDAKLTGEDGSDYFGYTVQMGGDTNGDGYAELLVGATADDDGGTTAGAAYIFFGAPR